MTGTRGTGRRRGTRGKTVLVNGIPEGAVMNREPVHTPTVRITGLPASGVADHDPPPAPSLAQDMTEGLASADLREFAESLADGPRGPIPNLGSPDPADRTEWFRLNGGSEQLFDATVADLDAGWLVHAGLPVPPAAPAASGTGSEGREEETAAPPPGAAEPSSRPGDGEEVADGRRRLSDTTDPGPGDVPPPAGAPTAPDAPGPVSTEDEPGAEPDGCAEDGGAA